MVKCKASEYIIIKMGIDIKESGNMGLSKGKEHISTKMGRGKVITTKENGKMIKKREKEFIIGKVAISKKESIRKGEDMEKLFFTASKE